MIDDCRIAGIVEKKREGGGKGKRNQSYNPTILRLSY
jgi:hypothetical protein